MANIVAKNNFQNIFISIIFHFLSVKHDIFYEGNTKKMLQKGTHLIVTKDTTYLMDNTQLLGIFSIST